MENIPTYGFSNIRACGESFGNPTASIRGMNFSFILMRSQFEAMARAMEPSSPIKAYLLSVDACR